MGLPQTSSGPSSSDRAGSEAAGSQRPCRCAGRGKCARQASQRPEEAPAGLPPEPPAATFHVEHERQLATLGSLVASIAHEINNILTPIASYADLARMHPGDEELTAKALQRAAAGARQASEIATAILSLATPDRGVAPSHCDDLRDIVHRSTLCLGSEPAARGVRVLWDAPQGLPLAIPGVALQQVLVNLLINALRASKRGGVIQVAASAGSTWNMAEITVRDAGEGIPEAKQAGIFRDFESGCGSTGLGLAICKRLLEKWGGSIRLAETGPDGTVFAVTAPIAHGQRNAA